MKVTFSWKNSCQVESCTQIFDCTNGQEHLKETVCINYYLLNLKVIKTHGSESQGQERAKRIAKNKMRDALLCFLHELTFS